MKNVDPTPAIACLYDLKETAAALKISVRTLQKLVAANKIPFHRFGRALRFDLPALRAATLTPPSTTKADRHRLVISK